MAGTGTAIGSRGTDRSVGATPPRLRHWARIQPTILQHDPDQDDGVEDAWLSVAAPPSLASCPS